jgi:hypothetical protein
LGFDCEIAIDALGLVKEGRDEAIETLLLQLQYSLETPKEMHIRLALYRQGYEPEVQLSRILEVAYADVRPDEESVKKNTLQGAVWALAEIGVPVKDTLPRLMEIRRRDDTCEVGKSWYGSIRQLASELGYYD